MRNLFIIIGITLCMMVQGQEGLGTPVVAGVPVPTSEECLTMVHRQDTLTPMPLERIMDSQEARGIMAVQSYYQQQYIDYCYADSFQVKVNPNIITPLFEEEDGILNETGAYTSTLMGGYKLIWRHSYPTFEGYTKWLEKLLK